MHSLFRGRVLTSVPKSQIFQTNFVRHTIKPVKFAKPCIFVRNFAVNPELQPKKEPQKKYWTPTFQEPQKTKKADIVNAPPTQESAEHGGYQSQFDYTSQQYDQTAGQTVEANPGLQRYLRKIALGTAGAIGVTLLAAGGTLAVVPVAMWKAAMIGSGIATVGCALGLGFSQPQFYRDPMTGEVTAQHSPLRKAMAGILFASSGVMLAPLLAMSVPAAIPAAAAVSVAVMAGMGSFALSRPRGSLLKWGAPLMIGMFGLIGVSVVGMLTGWQGAVMLNTVAGLGIFSLYTAYDLQVAIEQYMQGYPDELGSITNFYLNFINLFTRFLRIFNEMFGNSE